MYTSGNQTPITPVAVMRIVILFVIGVAILGGLFLLLKKGSSVTETLIPQDGFQCYFYRDADGDGRGNPAEKITGKLGVTPPLGYTTAVGDCDDNDPKK